MVGAWHGHGMASVNQIRPHCVNQMGKTHSKPLAAGERHAMCESDLCLLATHRRSVSGKGVKTRVTGVLPELPAN
jgi:hypothetical protein